MKNLFYVLMATSILAPTSPLHAGKELQEDISETKNVSRNLSRFSIDQLETYVTSLTEDLEKDYFTHLSYLASPIDIEKMPLLLAVTFSQLPTDPSEKEALLSKLQECEKRFAPRTLVVNNLAEAVQDFQKEAPHDRTFKIVNYSYQDLLERTNRTFKRGLGVLQLLLGDKEGHMTLANSSGTDFSDEGIKNSEIYVNHLFQYYKTKTVIDTHTYFEVLRKFAVAQGLQAKNRELIETTLQTGRKSLESYLSSLITETSYSYYKASYEKGLKKIDDIKNDRIFVLDDDNRERLQNLIKEHLNFNKAYAHYLMVWHIEPYANLLTFGHHHLNENSRSQQEVKKDFEDAEKFLKDKLTQVANFSFSNPEEQTAFKTTSKENIFLFKTLEEALKNDTHWAWLEFGKLRPTESKEDSY